MYPPPSIIIFYIYISFMCLNNYAQINISFPPGNSLELQGEIHFGTWALVLGSASPELVAKCDRWVSL